MTTRETTALMPLDDLDLNLSLGDRFMVMAGLPRCANLAETGRTALRPGG